MVFETGTGLEFIDKIYEAAVVPERWPEVLRGIAAISGSKGAILLSASQIFPQAITSSSEFEEFFETYLENVPMDHERTTRLLSSRHPGFIRDQDVFTNAEIESEWLFTGFLRKHGYGRGVATSVVVPSCDPIVIHAEGDYRDGPMPAEIVRRLDVLRPHLARSCTISMRLGLREARASVDALASIGLPAAVIGGSGQVVSTNRLMEAWIPEVYQDKSARLSASDARVDALLGAGIGAILRGVSGGICSMPVPESGDLPMSVLHLLPSRGHGRDIFGANSALAVITPVEARETPAREVIQALFDLTPAEAKVAEAIAQGATVAEYSDVVGTKQDTVRKQLKQVMSKSGLHRQSQLVGLLKSIGQFPHR